MSSEQEDEQIIRTMVDQAICRVNQGDVTAFDDFWYENADYVGVDGRLTKGRAQIKALFREMGKGGAGHQTATIEQIRFITPDLATVDGSWTVTGARNASGKELPLIKGRGFELVQKKNGRWWFVATREMVIFGRSWRPRSILYVSPHGGAADLHPACRHPNTCAECRLPPHVPLVPNGIVARTRRQPRSRPSKRRS